MSNIEFVVDEFNEPKDNLSYILTEFLSDDDIVQDYEMLNVKQLTQICEYYGLGKNIKPKSKKLEIVHMIMYFENLSINYLIVNRRKKLWFYMNELKNDKYMKKFILF